MHRHNVLVRRLLLGIGSNRRRRLDVSPGVFQIDMHPTREFWQEAAAIAVEYKGVGTLIRKWADAEDDAERLAILIDIVELMEDIKLAHP